MPRHFSDLVGISENHERAKPYELKPYDLGCILKFVKNKPGENMVNFSNLVNILIFSTAGEGKQTR